jgi:hypothetical protein
MTLDYILGTCFLFLVKMTRFANSVFRMKNAKGELDALMGIVGTLVAY